RRRPRLAGHDGRLYGARVAERHAERGGRLAGDTADRQRVAPVGSDLQLEHVVAQAEQFDDVRADGRVLRQHGDAGGGLGGASAMPSSASEQIIPSDSLPYVLREPISKPPGSTAPGSATGTTSPS